MPWISPGALARQGQRADVFGRKIGEIHIEASGRAPADRQQAAHDIGAECGGSLPADMRAVGPCLAQRDRRDTEQHPGHRSPNRTRKDRFQTKVGAAVDPRQKQLRRLGHQMARAHDGAVAGGSGDPVPPQPSLADPDRMMQADRVRDTALVVLRRDDPNLLGELAGDPLENCQTRRLDPVVVGYENAIQHSAAPLVRKT
jgi:hypothetical protein